jgi:leucyl-tRNA synthetase
MSEYRPQEVEEKWQRIWEESTVYHTEYPSAKPKYYVLDMFPYPSGAGLHVGHPLGYIATDILARYKKHKGFNVLHPMGFDAFGLPAEQYAIQTGQHPADTTEVNISTYKKQFKRLGFNYDWSREIRTSQDSYYKWTQWIFIKIFHSWYDTAMHRARPMDELIELFRQGGNSNVHASCDENTPLFSAEEWNTWSEHQQAKMLLRYRLAYLADTTVNWCPALGTVLSNDEVKDGFSERGGHPVVRKTMMQWMMRITAYADRLLQGLHTVDWPEPVKEMQRNWIGKSIGAQFNFRVVGHESTIEVFTTRLDTVFGVTFVVLAPEHPLVANITTREHSAEVEAYVALAKNKNERERLSEVKKVSGVFSGAFVVHPFSQEHLPVWIADYVLAGYGTGAIMAVPGHDERDHRFATYFNLPIKQVISGPDVQVEAHEGTEGTIIHSDFLNGLTVSEAIAKGIEKLEHWGIGIGKVQYRMRDAIFTRQRYWGEPLPVYFKDGVPYTLPESSLPLLLPAIDKYLPTEDGEPPLGRAKDWNYTPGMGIVSTGTGYPIELSTMPGWAGSSWYWFRYMDATKDTCFASKDAMDYWGQVDLYMGGSEHATGHLLYARFWCKILFDLGLVPIEEPFGKLINQGMIQGVSHTVWDNKKDKILLSRVPKPNELTYDNQVNFDDFFPQNIPVELVDKEGYILIEELVKWRSEYEKYDVQFLHKADEEKKAILTGSVVEKMSKSKYNVVNPDDICATYGADTLRLYEMFLGPLDQSKPWNTHGIDGVHRFLKKCWGLFHTNSGELTLSDAPPTAEEWKVLHKTIKKVEEDMERFSFNTTVSAFMIAVNEFHALKCNKTAILSPFVVLLSPFAPHIAEELWHLMGNTSSVTTQSFPVWKQEYLEESTCKYPISINGKVRATITLPLDMTPTAVEKEALANESVQKWMEGKEPKKVIVVPGRIVNVVV